MGLSLEELAESLELPPEVVQARLDGLGLEVSCQEAFSFGD